MKKKILISMLFGSVALIPFTLIPVLASVNTSNSSDIQKITSNKNQTQIVTAKQIEKNDIIPSLRRPTENINDKILTVSKNLGITREDKNIEQIQHEIKKELMKQKATEKGISTQGKDEETISNELNAAYEEEKEKQEDKNKSTNGNHRLWHSEKEEEFKKDAEEKGINVEGKSSFEIYVELNKEDILKKAEDLGIEVKGKSIDEIIKEAKDILQDKQYD